MVRKGICSRYIATKPHRDGIYELGQKRCSQYSIFLNWEGKHCSCCGYVFRTKPKDTQTRHKLMVVQ